MGEAVIAAAAADLDRTARRRDDQRENHLSIKADAATEPQVELNAVDVDAVPGQPIDQLAEVADRLRRERRQVWVEALEDAARGPAQLGQGVSPVADFAERLR